MVSLLIYFLVLCIVFGLIWWVLGMVPLPGPFGRIAQVVLVVIFVIILLVEFLLPIAGMGTGGTGLGIRHY